MKTIVLMKNHIKTFSMTKLLVGSCADFHNKVLGFITKSTPAALHIEDKVPAYEASVEKLTSIVNRQRAFVSTQALASADDVRDQACGTISAVVNAFLNSPVDEKREAAELLAPKLAPYKGIRNHKYTKQTAEIKGMYAVLTDAENTAAVTLLGLDEETAKLLEANEDFERLFLQKAAEAGEKAKVSELDSMELMAEANARYSEIADIVNAYAIVQTSDEVETFIDEVNGLVEVYSKEAGASSGSGKPATETPGGDSETPGEDTETPGTDEPDDRPTTGGEDDQPTTGGEDEDDEHEGPAIQ